jgi:diguanylate cyclase (GGDEF)-like protein
MHSQYEEAAQAESNTLAGPAQRKLALALAIVLALIALAALPHARAPGPVIAPFLPAYIALVSALDLVTTILFLLQYRQHGRASTLALACAYFYTSLIVVPHLLGFPAVFSPAGLMGAGPQTAVWLWVFWHGGFPALLLVHGVLLRREQAAGAALARGRARVLPALSLVALLVLAVSALAFLASDKLPAIIQKDNYLALITSGVGPTVFLLNLAALVLLWRTTRGRGVTQLWLLVAVLASLLDVTVTLAAGARYSLGWYVARANSLLCAGLVLGAFLFEFHRLQMMLSSANQRLAALADTDGLTGLGNRRAFDRKLAQEWARAARDNESVALLLLDIDYFKRFNDTYGHQAGDACLQRVAAAIQGGLHRPSDFAARYGGEEMAVILPQTDLVGARHVADAIRAAIEAQDTEHRASDAGVVTASIGVAAAMPAARHSISELVAQADTALYAAKERGRNRVHG